MRVTRKDVAKYAGVSEQTVSYILNDSRKFSKEIVEKVQRAIEDLHYKPDMVAKSMVKKKTDTVAIIVRDMANPIFPAIIHGFQEQAFECGYSVYISDVAGRCDVESQINDLISRRIDGIYISLLSEKNINDIVKRFIDNNVKVVLGNEDDSLQFRLPVVGADMDGGMRKIVGYLKEKGHRDIVYLNGLDPTMKSDKRYEAFLEAYGKLFGDDPTVVDNDPPYLTTVEDGMKLVDRLLATGKNFTAIVTTNDLMAYGVIDRLTCRGYRIPEDVSVVGIDDILYSKYINPPLTTLGYDYRFLGKKIFSTLFAEINGERASSAAVETNIVERGTVRDLTESLSPLPSGNE